MDSRTHSKANGHPCRPPTFLLRNPFPKRRSSSQTPPFVTCYRKKVCPRRCWTHLDSHTQVMSYVALFSIPFLFSDLRVSAPPWWTLLSVSHAPARFLSGCFHGRHSWDGQRPFRRTLKRRHRSHRQ